MFARQPAVGFLALRRRAECWKLTESSQASLPDTFETGSPLGICPAALDVVSQEEDGAALQYGLIGLTAATVVPLVASAALPLITSSGGRKLLNDSIRAGSSHVFLQFKVTANCFVCI